VELRVRRKRRKTIRRRTPKRHLYFSGAHDATPTLSVNLSKKAARGSFSGKANIPRKTSSPEGRRGCQVGSVKSEANLVSGPNPTVSKKARLWRRRGERKANYFTENPDEAGELSSFMLHMAYGPLPENRIEVVSGTKEGTRSGSGRLIWRRERENIIDGFSHP